jgi:hypothetical protein
LFTGTYTLASGTTIEFAGGGSQRTVAYQNIAITGNNSASSVNCQTLEPFRDLSFTNMGQMNSNAPYHFRK